MEKSEILKRETDNLLKGVDSISERFKELEQDTLGTYLMNHFSLIAGHLIVYHL